MSSREYDSRETGYSKAQHLENAEPQPKLKVAPSEQPHIETPTNRIVSESSFEINDYELGALIGQGGMGAVYRAHHKAIDKTIAVKFLHKALAQDPVNVQRFRQEVKAASLLTHPNLIAVYDSGIAEDGTPYLVMDHVDGETLDVVLRREGFINTEYFLELFIQIAEALVHAHTKGVVHRDLKPSNIMLVKKDDQELVKVLDFGIARVLQRDEETTSAQLTTTGAVLGSPVYMSPEQCLSKSIDERSDVYSLGAVMYHALTGQPPFVGDGPVELIVKHVHDKARAPSKLRPDLKLPLELEDLVMKALEKSPDKRQQSIHEILDQLLAIRDRSLGMQAWSPRRSATRAMRGFNPKIAAGIATISLLILGSFVLVSLNQQKDNSTPAITTDSTPAPIPPADSTPATPEKTTITSGYKIKNAREELIYQSKASNLSEALQEAARAHVKLHGAMLYDAVIKNVDLTGIDLSNSDMRNARLENVILNKARIQNVDLVGANLSDVQMKNANCSATNFPVSATQSSFDGSTFNASFDSGNFVNCTFTGAKFTGSNLQQTQFRQCNFDNAMLDRCEFGVIDGCSFKGARLIKADFNRAFQVTMCDFTGAKVSLNGKVRNEMVRDNNIEDRFLD